MTLYERVKFRLSMMRAGLRAAGRDLRLGWFMPRIAGGAGDDDPPKPKDPPAEDPKPDDDPKPKDPPAEDPKPDDDPKDPPWGKDEDFDAKRAWELIQNVRSDAEKAKTEREELRAKVKKHEDSTKSDQEKLEERAGTAEKRASDAEGEVMRLRVALRKGLSETQAKRLVGDSEEALEKDADELLASFKEEGEGDQEPPRRPRERMRPGAAPRAEPDENDPEKLAESVKRW